jgi:hypothetical protein
MISCHTVRVRCSTTTVSFTKIKRLSILRVVVLYSTEVLSYYRTKVLSYNVVHVRKYESTFEDCTSGIVRTSLAYSTIINRYSTSYLRKGVSISGSTSGSAEIRTEVRKYIRTQALHHNL